MISKYSISLILRTIVEGKADFLSLEIALNFLEILKHGGHHLSNLVFGHASEYCPLEAPKPSQLEVAVGLVNLSPDVR